MPLGRLRQAKPAGFAHGLRRLLRSALNFGLRQATLDGLPKTTHFLGGRGIGAELGYAPAVARRLLVVDPRKDQGEISSPISSSASAPS